MNIRNLIIGSMAATALLTGVSCERSLSGHGDGKISENVLKTFTEMYPYAIDVRWSVNGNYAVADFRMNNTPDMTAWFSNYGGQWGMTETDIAFEDLPQPVKDAFIASEYATWTISDVDMLERKCAEIIYVIEVENMADGVETEVDLYYSPDGVLVKTVIDSDRDDEYDDYIPSDPGQSILEFIEARYPGARITDVDREEDGIEVEIIDGKTVRELLFDLQDNWIYTRTDLRRCEIPQEIMTIFNASEYAAYVIEDAEHFDTATKGEFYRFEIELADTEIKIDIFPDGTITSVTDEDDDYDNDDEYSSNIPQPVVEFIKARYPGATIIDSKRERGILEVEILHENIEKDIWFGQGNTWKRSEWEVRWEDVPQTVASAVSEQYPGYETEDIHFVESPEGQWYEIEIENDMTDDEIAIKVSPEGVIIR